MGLRVTDGTVFDAVVTLLTFALRQFFRAGCVKVKDCRVHRVAIFFRRALRMFRRFNFRFRVRIEVGDPLKGTVRREPADLRLAITRSDITWDLRRAVNRSPTGTDGG